MSVDHPSFSPLLDRHVDVVLELECFKDPEGDTSLDAIVLGQRQERNQTKDDPTRRSDKACLLLNPHF